MGLDPAHRQTRRRVSRAASSQEDWLTVCGGDTGLAVILAHDGAVTHLPETPEPALERSTEAAIELNGDSPRSLERFAPAAIGEKLDGESVWDGIVCDLAAVEATTGLESSEILERCLQAVTSGGHLLVFTPPAGLLESLENTLESAAEATGRSLESLDAFGPPADFPPIDGFPEGTPFVGVHASL